MEDLRNKYVNMDDNYLEYYQVSEWSKDNEYIKPRIIVLTRRYDRKMLFKRICRNTLGSSNKGIIEGINIHKISEEEWGEDPLTEESKNKNINDP